jgi:hypothetical protein
VDTIAGDLVPTYYCPICGIGLEQSDFDKAAEHYFCPYCCSQQPPSRAMKRAGWGTAE